jgi:hypothetical protein
MSAAPCYKTPNQPPKAEPMNLKDDDAYHVAMAALIVMFCVIASLAVVILT